MFRCLDDLCFSYITLQNFLYRQLKKATFMVVHMRGADLGIPQCVLQRFMWATCPRRVSQWMMWLNISQRYPIFSIQPFIWYQRRWNAFSIQFGSVADVHWPQHKITNVFMNFCFVTFSQVSINKGDLFCTLHYTAPILCSLQLILLKYVLNAIWSIHLHQGGDWEVVGWARLHLHQWQKSCHRECE